MRGGLGSGRSLSKIPREDCLQIHIRIRKLQYPQIIRMARRGNRLFCSLFFIRKRRIVKMQSQIPFSCRSRKAVEETDDYDKIDIVSAEGRSVRKDAETAM